MPFHELRSEIYLELCDFRSAVAGIQKMISHKRAASTKQNPAIQGRQSVQDQRKSVSSIPATPADFDENTYNEKVGFLRYITGITLFDQKLYFDAFGIIVSGSNIFATLAFQVYR